MLCAVTLVHKSARGNRLVNAIVLSARMYCLDTPMQGFAQNLVVVACASARSPRVQRAKVALRKVASLLARAECQVLLAQVLLAVLSAAMPGASVAPPTPTPSRCNGGRRNFMTVPRRAVRVLCAHGGPFVGVYYAPARARAPAMAAATGENRS